MKSQRGFTLIETVLAIALVGIIGAAFVGALVTSFKAVSVANERQTAKTLAEHQMEYVMSQGYATFYTPAPISSEYSNYSVTISTDHIPLRDANIQEIKVTVSHKGKPVIMVENCTLLSDKVN